MILKLVAVILILIAVNASAQEADTIRLLQDVVRLNENCRGGTGDNIETWKACGARDYVGWLLYQKGYCFGKEADAGFEMEWHICEMNSNNWERPRYID